LSRPVDASTYDKVHVVVITEYAGRRYDADGQTPLQKMACLRQILETLRLVRDEGWLHRDISPANLAIPEKGKSGLSGTIIDWDMARRVNVADEGSQEWTGTLWYMAAGILLNMRSPPIHHVLHDIESVFWVGFLDGLKKSSTADGEFWIQQLHQCCQIFHIGAMKQKLNNSYP